MREKWMRRITALVIAVMCMSIITVPVRAEETAYHIYDYQELLTPEERTALGTSIKEAEEKCGMPVILVTNTYTKEAATPQAYADDFFDYGGFGEDGILLLIDMENRQYHIATTGKAIERFGDSVIQKMQGPIENALGADQVYLAATDFVADALYYGDKSIKPMEWLLYLGIAVIAGVIVFLAVLGKYKIKFSQYHYPINDRGKIQLTNKQDNFLRENVVSRKIETSSSGGSSTHTSSSGRSHGGGGGSF